MAQVSMSDAVPMSIGKLEISTDGTTYDDVSGYGFTLEVGGGERMQGAMYTLEGDTAIITGGKREPLELTFKGLYTEDENSPFETVWTQYDTDGGGGLYVRWSPKAGDIGDDQFTSDQGIVTACLPPGVDPESGDPTPFAFTLVTPKVTKSAISA